MIRALFLTCALATLSLQQNPQTNGVSNETLYAEPILVTTTQYYKCGKVPNADSVAPIVNSPSGTEGQWPWHVAIYQTRSVNNMYTCGGTLVSPRHVITVAQCVLKKGPTNKTIDKNTLTVHLGKTNLRTSYDGVQFRLVKKIKVHPDYDFATYNRNLAILELKDPVSYTNWVQPVCLWPENQQDLSNIVGKKGTVVGWGSDETGELSEELKVLEIPVVDQVTCIWSFGEFFGRFTSNYTFCAGNRDSGKSVCNGDNGGGMVFKNEDTWLLRGLVSVSVSKMNFSVCDPTHYAVFTDIAKLLTWIKANIGDL